MAKSKKSTSHDAAWRKAKQIDREVRRIVLQIERSWVAIARLAASVKKQELHLKLGFRRFNDWLVDAVGRRKSTIYVAMAAVEELADVPDEKLKRMTLDNASKLARVPKSKRTPELVERAQKETGKQFTRSVNHAAPGVLTEDDSATHFEFWGEPSLIAVVEQAIQVAMILERTDSRTKAIERVVSEFVLNHPEPELERAALDQQETGQDEMLVEANSNEGKAS